MRVSLAVGVFCLLAVSAVVVTLAASHKAGPSTLLSSPTAAFTKEQAQIAQVAKSAATKHAAAQSETDAARVAQAASRRDLLQAKANLEKSKQLAAQVKRNTAMEAEAKLELAAQLTQQQLNVALAKSKATGEEDVESEQAMAVAQQKLSARRKSIEHAKQDAADLTIRANELAKQAATAKSRGQEAETNGMHDREVAKTAKLQLAKLANSAKAFHLQAQALLEKAKKIRDRIRAHKAKASEQKHEEAAARNRALGYEANVRSLKERLSGLKERANVDQGRAADDRADMEVLENTVARRKSALARANAEVKKEEALLLSAKDTAALDAKQYGSAA